MTADGQSTVCRANEYASESDENIREILEGQGRRLQTLSSAVEKINRSLNALLENMNGSLQRQESPGSHIFVK